MKIIKVTWVDSCSHQGWRDWDSEIRVSVIESIGYLIMEDKDKITISSSVDLHYKSSADPLSIPKRAIQKRRYVKI